MQSFNRPMKEILFDAHMCLDVNNIMFGIVLEPY